MEAIYCYYYCDSMKEFEEFTAEMKTILIDVHDNKTNEIKQVKRGKEKKGKIVNTFYSPTFKKRNNKRNYKKIDNEQQ